MRVTNRYDENFKNDAVSLARKGDRTVAQVARDLGMSHWTLREWCKHESMAKRQKKVPTTAAPVAAEDAAEKLKRLERENARLQRENETLRVDREILKKAAAFFAKESE